MQIKDNIKKGPKDVRYRQKGIDKAVAMRHKGCAICSMLRRVVVASGCEWLQAASSGSDLRNTVTCARGYKRLGDPDYNGETLARIPGRR